ncbi:hypothetical protein [Natribacillus halophilus]|uniref:hypothetical protein n=1 Tax=Natribacillus halophilus TaxID=549003 RepID=UPI00115FB2A8|nr:hypothetical protein [Natribacillus halophilus]
MRKQQTSDDFPCSADISKIPLIPPKSGRSSSSTITGTNTQSILSNSYIIKESKTKKSIRKVAPPINARFTEASITERGRPSKCSRIVGT